MPRYGVAWKGVSGVRYEEFCRAVENVVESLPPKLLERLNGGFNVIRRKKEDGDYLLFGEYVEDPVMGYIVYLYYGTFVEELEGASRDEWLEEIEETVVHELRHHIESLAGVDDLAVEEMLGLAKLGEKTRIVDTRITLD